MAADDAHVTIERRAPLGVIADDLTGAMDTGLQFAKRGLYTLVHVGPGQLPEADAWVLDTDSRASSPNDAMNRASEAARALLGRRVYKKIDSTMRGNIGSELLGVLDVLRCDKAVVAPAFPPAGRSTVHGHQMLNGTPLEKTGFARDPRWPMRESYIPDIIARQAGELVGHVELRFVEGGSDALRSAIEAAGERLVSVDAVTAGHLTTIGQVLAEVGPRWLPCGSAGLAEGWLPALGLATRTCVKPRVKRERPVIVAATSRSEVTAGQIDRAQSELHVPIVSVKVHRLTDDEARGIERRRLAEAVSEQLANGSDVILASSMTPLVVGLGRGVAILLGQVLQNTLSEHVLGGLFLTGGDLAVATCRALGTSAIRLEDEVQPGVPAGTLVGGDYEGLPVVTKAGGFGNERAIVDALSYLHGA